MKVQTHSSKTVFKNKWRELKEDSISFNGKEFEYFFLEAKDAVTIIPVDKNGNTLTIRVYRHPSKTHNWELPCGAIESGESILAAAARELEEETTLKTTQFEIIGEAFPSPGAMTQKLTICIAYFDTIFDTSRTIIDTDDMISDIKVVSFESLHKLIFSGEVTDAYTITALFYLEEYQRKNVR